ncbi:MAG: ribose-phosphate pyrophosphokinase [Patescibacteria group bacterium]|jgi:ribose-phosphate pyrophosphokinase
MQPLVFSGSSSPELAARFAGLNNFAIGSHKVVRFANSEVKVTVEQNVHDVDCFIVLSTSNPTDMHVMELAFTVDALKREGAGEITCVIPYFGYARQNIQHLPGECVSAHVVIRLLESLKVNKVIVVDLHDEGTAGVFSIPFRSISVLPYLASRIYENLGITAYTESSVVIASPDQGGIERARKFAEAFYKNLKGYDLVTVEKKRNLANIHDSKAMELYGDVQGKTVIFVDDIATSGGTIIHASELALSKGAKEVYAAVVHPDFGPGIPEKIQVSTLTRFFTTNTIEKTVEDLKPYSKIEVIDISEVLKV